MRNIDIYPIIALSIFFLLFLGDTFTDYLRETCYNEVHRQTSDGQEIIGREIKPECNNNRWKEKLEYDYDKFMERSLVIYQYLAALVFCLYYYNIRKIWLEKGNWKK